MRLSPETLVRCGVPAEKARAHLPYAASAMRENEIATPRRARMFLAQVMHESAALRYFEEIASGAAYEGRTDLGNTQPGDGRRFKGRGPIQLTGRHNYTLYGKLLGIDLVKRPELAATPRVGWRVAALFFHRAGCNDAADRRDFQDVTRRINGGLNGYADRVRYYRLLGGAGVVPGPAALGRGDRGDAVVTMTRRLSFVRAKGGGEPYLDGARKAFDAEAERALRAFQEDRGLEVDGRYGPLSAKALARATEGEKRRRAAAREKPRRVPEKPRERGPERERQGTSVALLAQLDRVDARGDELREALIGRHRALQRALERHRELDAADLKELGTQLERLDAVIHEVQSAMAAPAPVMTVGNGIVTQAAPGASAVAVAEKTATEVTEPGIEELTNRLVALDAEEDRIRALLADRFRALEEEVARVRGPRPEPTPRRRRSERRRPRPKPSRRPREPKEDGPEGEGARIRPDERGYRVRQSKVALARYLRRHRARSTAQLRRTLLREARSPGTARVATPAWERAVKEAQAIAGLPVTGELDGALTRALRAVWPSESALRRILRGTPAWRTIPGQLSPNFNLREFACSDGTPYVAGLVREQGLTKTQAKARAKQLADRLERVRAANGDRPLRVSSVFRSKSYNARIPGSATNSAHLTGHAADMPTPAGVPLATHHKHVLAAFESGVGLYTSDNFVHGDFKPGGRRTW